MEAPSGELLRLAPFCRSVVLSSYLSLCMSLFLSFCLPCFRYVPSFSRCFFLTVFTYVSLGLPSLLLFLLSRWIHALSLSPCLPACPSPSPVRSLDLSLSLSPPILFPQGPGPHERPGAPHQLLPRLLTLSRQGEDEVWQHSL